MDKTEEEEKPKIKGIEEPKTRKKKVKKTPKVKLSKVTILAGFVTGVAQNPPPILEHHPRGFVPTGNSTPPPPPGTLTPVI